MGDGPRDEDEVRATSAGMQAVIFVVIMVGIIGLFYVWTALCPDGGSPQ